MQKWKTCNNLITRYYDYIRYKAWSKYFSRGELFHMHVFNILNLFPEMCPFESSIRGA